MATALWWIRRDLRLTDNAALQAALSQSESIVPVFILDPKLLNSQYACARRIAFLLEGLRLLDENLRQHGSRLLVRAGNPRQELARLCQESNVSLICAERDHSPYATQRDQNVAEYSNVPLQLSEGLTVHPPELIYKADKTPYTVFTPFSRRWKERGVLYRADILPVPPRIRTPDHLPSLALPVTFGETILPAGEEEAKRRLTKFTKGERATIYRYKEERNRPDLEATSQLAPYLRFGMISARSAAVAAYEAIDEATGQVERENAECWLNELIWREFYISILRHFPHVRQGSFRRQYNAIDWVNNQAEFAAWCAGQTGYPIVDAAMRQLKETGWMHNRSRMIVASFLVKHLLIDWRWGERWFMQQLIDGDPAANNGGWQWSAGTGTDAAPYFRIFNPVSQGQKFDPDGSYVRRWVPELCHVATQFIHEPWKMSRSEQSKAHCLIGQEYPAPIVDHGFARERVLLAYKNI